MARPAPTQGAVAASVGLRWVSRSRLLPRAGGGARPLGHPGTPGTRTLPGAGRPWRAWPG